MEHLPNNFKNKSTGTTITRVMISFIILKDLVIYLAHAETLFGSSAIVPYQVYSRILESYNLQFLQYPFYNQAATLLFLAVSVVACLLFLLGIRKYITGTLLFLCLFELKNRNIFIMDGADNVIWIMLPFLTLAQSQPLLSNHEKTKSQAPPNPASVKDHLALLAVLGITIQLCFIYFFTALSKMLHDIWQNGTALYYILRLEEFRGSPLNVPLTKNAFFVKSITWFTLLWEAAFPFLIWFNKTKKYVIAAGILMHAGIFLFMRIDNFSFVMVSLYPCLFTNEELKAVLSRISGISLFKKSRPVFALQTHHNDKC